MQKNILILAVLSALVLSTVPALGQAAPELLEKGIYIEETVGDVRRAKAVYRRILTDVTADRTTVAEALFRLGMCHLKTGNTGGASEAFERILAEYPEQEHLVARARQQMPEDPNVLELLPAPWPDGEVMRMRLELASGTPLGAILMTADAAELDGEELWRLRVRRKVFSDTDNQAISQVLARRDTMVPVASVFKHSVVGHFAADYGDGAVSIETIGAGTTREQELNGLVFDNEEGFHLFRRLPLEVGYKRTIRVISPMAGGVTSVGVEVTEIEKITVPAGDFECYRLEFSVPQVFWYSTDPSHTLVKLEAAGIVGELEEVTTQQPGRENVHRDEELGYSLSLPPDWLAQAMDHQGMQVLFLLDPSAEAQARLEIRRSFADGCARQAAAARKLAQARAALHDYALRDGTWSEHTLAGRPAVSFVGDYREIDRKRVHYWTFIESGELCADFTLKIPADRFAALRPAFDSIIESYDGPSPPAAAVWQPGALRVRETVLADFYSAVAQADPGRAFAHLAPEAMLFGPDAADRFDVRQLRQRFAEVKDWLVEPFELHVAVSFDESLAWFDGRLESRHLGELRSSGVLRREAGEWKIVQLHVALPVPDPLVGDLAEQLRAHDQAVGRRPAGPEPFDDGSAADPAAAARSMLRDFHLAKPGSESERFFGHLAPEAVVLLTDRAERLTLGRLRAHLQLYGDQGPALVPVAQHVHLSPDQSMAWFEEQIEEPRFGRMRGTGVLRKIGDAWKIVHYNLVLLVPKELAGDLARRIGVFYAPAMSKARPAARRRGSAGRRQELARTVWQGLITAPESQVNEFTFLTDDSASGSPVLAVKDSGLNAHGRFENDLGAGDLVLVVQMQGASIESGSHDVSWGRVKEYRGCGDWELATVASVPDARSIELESALEHPYSARGRTQVVRVPRYDSLVIRAGASLVTQRWNGATGGVLALSIDGDLTIEQGARIDASGSGFRGGRMHQGSNQPQHSQRLISERPADGAEKGESIAGTGRDYSRWGGMYCYAAAANGGGGGNSHNAAGGGGANAGQVDLWTGNGNPDISNPEWAKAWDLEFEGFSQARSSGGGRGGYSWSNNDADATVDAPGTRAWAGDERRPVGGLGGRPLDYSTGRLFLGGGGGSGEANGPNGTPGGNGGGLIFIRSAGAVRGGGEIVSHGQDVRPTATIGKTAGDGPGGGGAGGTIVIAAESIAGLTVAANGGRGGDQRIENTAIATFYYEAEGGGGGGGGGYISLSGHATEVKTEVRGGKNGVTNSPALTEFPPNGGTAGGDGMVLVNGSALAIPGTERVGPADLLSESKR